MTTIKYKNGFFVNGKPVSTEGWRKAWRRKRKAINRLSLMRQARAFRILSERQGW